MYKKSRAEGRINLNLKNHFTLTHLTAGITISLNELEGYVKLDQSEVVSDLHRERWII